jgi:hypothetical protein
VYFVCRSVCIVCVHVCMCVWCQYVCVVCVLCEWVVCGGVYLGGVCMCMCSVGSV